MGRYLPPQWTSLSKTLYDDGIITYSAPKGSYRKVFKQIERVTGLNFKRVRKRNKPEIKCIYVKDLGPNSGLCSFNEDMTGFVVRTERQHKNKYFIEAHEVGHALGLAHVERTTSAMDISWEYPHKLLSGWDLNNISDLFFG